MWVLLNPSFRFYPLVHSGEEIIHWRYGCSFTQNACQTNAFYWTAEESLKFKEVIKLLAITLQYRLTYTSLEQ